MSELQRITVDPQQCGGRPCIRSLRIRVKDVLDLLASGASHDEILEDYPLLEAADIAAVLEFAARQNDHPILRVEFDGSDVARDASGFVLSTGPRPSSRRHWRRSDSIQPACARRWSSNRRSAGGSA